MKHAQYYRNIANGIARINQCIFACKLAPVETGTFYSKRFKKNNHCLNPDRIADGVKGFWFPGGFYCKCKNCEYKRNNQNEN